MRGVGDEALLREDRWARVALSRTVEPGTVEVSQWVERLGAPAAYDGLASGRLPTKGAYAARIAVLDIGAAKRAIERIGVRVLVPGDEEWPSGLEDLEKPPLCLYAKGDGHVEELLQGSIAVVGARAATEYGLRIAAELGQGLVARGVTVVSGAAFGIDAAAHRGALAARGPTVAVLACGLDRSYPQAHERLLRSIAAAGAIIGEVPIGFAPYRARFLLRNRLIAAVTVGTVVVEASLRSGSLNTAKHAREHHRHVAAVPGPVTSMSSAGCHDLVRTKGAALVTDAADVLDLMGRLGLDALKDRRAPESPDAELDPVAHGVWSAVPVRACADLERMCYLTGVGHSQLLAVLGRLELDGLVIHDDEGWRKAARVRRQPARPQV